MSATYSVGSPDDWPDSLPEMKVSVKSAGWFQLSDNTHSEKLVAPLLPLPCAESAALFFPFQGIRIIFTPRTQCQARTMHISLLVSFSPPSCGWGAAKFDTTRLKLSCVAETLNTGCDVPHPHHFIWGTKFGEHQPPP